MQVLLDNINSIIIPAACSILSALIAALIAWIKSKIKNSKLVDFIPDAMLYAESIGGAGSTKMENALMYLRDKFKNFSEKTARNYIERFITVSKTINKKGVIYNVDKSPTSRITESKK